ncbi:MAG: cob(I)yrinic acid a,c-diamide adenosyltransferase [Dehalococcoidia bacterium]|nr:cob(I)yrinic acid a,c-diamide adenosyltransferase [Dehalococcoidia bacterium]
MKTFNKRGDHGETSLLYGVRVPKNDPRCEAYGTVDEVVSALGLARCYCKRVPADTLLDLQRGLFKVGAELATPPEHYHKLVASGGTITPEMADGLEKQIVDLECKVEMPRAFILPGAVPGAAALDLSRAVVRRAERRVVDLVQSGEVKNAEVERFLNRLADLLFTLARYEEADKRICV